MIPPKEFLKKIKPFSFLSEEELDIILSGLEVALFEKDHTIYQKDRRREYVYLISSGLVGIFDDDGPVDYLSKGEVFGLLSVNGRPSFLTAKALEETTCYLIPIEAFEKVLTVNERFASFFRSLMSRRFRSFKFIASEGRISEEAAFAIAVEQIIYKKPVICGPESTIATAVREMEAKGVSSVVIADKDARPVGILTHKDLRRVILDGDRTSRVRDFMSGPLKTIPAGTTVFDALTMMIDAGIDHMVVTREDRLLGVVTRKDIQIHLEPSSSVVALFRRVAKAASIDEVGILFKSIRTAIAKMALKEPNFYNLSRMMSSMHDTITARVVDLVRKEDSVNRFTWLHMGSSGRREEIIASDQDNAIIGEGNAIAELAEGIVEGLHAIGVYKCPGDYMASNSKWNQPVSVWKEYFKHWLHDPVPQHVRYLSIFLDMRPITGIRELYNELLETIRSNVTADAVRLLVQDAVEIQPPVGIFGLYRLHRGVDLKMYGIYPIVNGVRVLALDQGLVEVTNTRERVEALSARGVVDDQMCHDLLESFGFLQDLRLRHQSRAVLSGTRVDNLVRVKELSKTDILVLKESFKVVAAFQKFLMKNYNVRRAGSIGF